MGKTIAVVDSSDISINWSDYYPLINSALKYNDGTHTLSGILTDLLLGSKKLIVCRNYDVVEVVTVIEFIYNPSKAVCNISFLAGENIEVYKDDFLNFVFRYAKEYGADSVQAYGRKGWKRFLSSFEFKEIYTVLERKL